MTEIILVRHGQANSQATDEDSYDKLSDLGHQQAKWLGRYLRDTGEAFDTVHCGTLRRHQETAAGMGYTAPLQDERLNEFRYFDMAEALQEIGGLAIPAGAEAFKTHIFKLTEAWEAGHLDHAHVPYRVFAERMRDAVADVAQPGGRHLFVTSAGVIGMMLTRVLGLPPSGYARILLPIMNTSIHKFQIEDGTTGLTQFNALPHLAQPDRAFAKTYF